MTANLTENLKVVFEIGICLNDIDSKAIARLDRDSFNPTFPAEI